MRRSVVETLARPRAQLLIAIAFQIVVWIVAQRDLPVDDPLAYSENAFWMGDDPGAYFHAPSKHPFAMRLGLTVPLALLTRVLGVGQTTTNLLSLLAFLAITLVVYRVAPTDRAKRIGLGFTSLSTALVLHATALSADLVCGAVTAVSLLLLSRRRIVAAVVVWFFAFQVKETTIWFAPVWAYVLVLDARALGWRATLRRFAPGLVVGAVLAGAYLVVCAHVWGDPLARMHGINEISGDHLWSSRDRSPSWWLHRLTWGPLHAYLAAFGAALLVALAGVRRIRGPERIWVVALACFLLIFWFGSASTREYVPLPLAPRRMLMVGLPSVLVTATLAADAFRWRRWVAALVVAATLLPFAFALGKALRADHPERAAYGALRDDLATPGDILLVCPDFRCLNAANYALGIRLPSRVQLVSIVDFARGQPPRPGTRVRVVSKRHRARAAMYATPEALQAIDALGLPPLYAHPALRLYDAGDGARLHTALRSLYAPSPP